MNMMISDSFAFMVALVHELENQVINRRAVDRLVEEVEGHKRRMNYKSHLWNCERCFCATPLMRSFDRFGGVAVTFLNEDLILE